MQHCHSSVGLVDTLQQSHEYYSRSSSSVSHARVISTETQLLTEPGANVVLTG